MKRINVIISVVLLAVLLYNESFVFASPSGNETAYCVGTDYADGVNTTNVALDAEYNYQLMGLTAYADIVPTRSSMNSSHSNGTKYLASGIVFLDGHGASSKMIFNYQGRGGNYAVGVTKGSSNVTESGCYLYGLGGYDLSDVALYVFAGCNTASGSDNITKWVVDNGARTSLGWTESVGTTSFSEWLYRFNNAIRAGSTVINACSIADSYSYSDPRVYNHTMYGYYYVNPYSLINPSGISVASELARPSVVRFDDISEDNVEGTIKKYLWERFGEDALLFNVSSYGVHNKVFDCSMKYDNVLSNFTITFLLEDGVLIGYDNTNNIELSKVKNIINSFKQKYTDEQLKDEWDNLFVEISESIEGDINSFEQYLYFDVNAECVYLANKYIATDKYGLGFAECEMRSIK